MNGQDGSKDPSDQKRLGKPFKGGSNREPRLKASLGNALTFDLVPILLENVDNCVVA